MKKRIPLGYKIHPDLLERVDAIRAGFPAVTERSACLDRAIDDWCIKWERAPKDSPEKSRKSR